MADDATLPTMAELSQLPRWAGVAFAARCARRVVPLIPQHWSDVPREDLKTLLQAIRSVEQSAETARDLVSRSQKVAVNAVHSRAKQVSSIAGHAAFAVYASTVAAHGKGNTTALYASKADPTEIPAVRRDFVRLLDESRREGWTDETPIPPSIFEAFPIPWLGSEPSAFVIELFAGLDANPNVMGESLVKLWEVANEYHMARGGGVLTFDEFKQMMPALVPVGPKAEG
jgi:hypothetical protein